MAPAARKGLGLRLPQFSVTLRRVLNTAGAWVARNNENAEGSSV